METDKGEGVGRDSEGRRTDKREEVGRNGGAREAWKKRVNFIKNRDTLANCCD